VIAADRNLYASYWIFPPRAELPDRTYGLHGTVLSVVVRPARTEGSVSAVMVMGHPREGRRAKAGADAAGPSAVARRSGEAEQGRPKPKHDHDTR
jgi:hypothetical protein